MLNAESWYAIWTRSHCERLVAEQLSARGFAPFLPEIPTPSVRASRTRFMPAPMFPGYLFVRDAMTKARYIELLQARGIVRVLEGGWTRLTTVPEAAIDAIQRIVSSGVGVFPHPLLRHGDRVRVIEGPLSGVEGIFVQESQQKGRLVVTIDLLGRSVAVEVNGGDVVRCN
ncbi:MAG: transcription termination/antitermination protein NusG [Vicinamibacterales bacterium]